jgi:mRNA interferase RelE/StbE
VVREAAERRGRRRPSAAKVVVRLTEPAFDDLRGLLRKDPQIVRWALKKMLHLQADPEAGQPLHGVLIGWRKLVVGDRDWRVIWRVTHDGSGGVIVDVAEVWAVGARPDSEVYAEMAERASRMPTDPRTLALTDVMSRLGKASRGLVAQAEPSAAGQLPDWLVRRLTDQAGMQMSEVVGLTLQEGLDAWTSWVSRPQS